MNFKDKIRVVENFPEEGISFKDITTLMKDGPAFHQAIDELASQFASEHIELVVGPEARGFAVGAPLAYTLGAGFVPVRKPGKLPAPTYIYDYSLEYGKDCLEIHRDAIQPGQKVLIADDLLATGGTTLAAIHLIEKLGGQVVGLAYMIELAFLEGRKKLKDYRIVTLTEY
ncbi:adenine phosphoribosyltransferase [Sporomusaceae bacterium BoRhaA]|uniref:adenine phosphoribosyltransferase n=1 Tax=Pelorhabdus rhamnosifermentans TaxID=2772457 RepID=UPI001C061806|nr:adenine phosphoribosyltransferase [Pelorhabdus rhamnosifermentans]MBU2700898.1 adenine phosphoribosyltransferase [Pelorhabdus rhamnosifermentans]